MFSSVKVVSDCFPLPVPEPPCPSVILQEISVLKKCSQSFSTEYRGLDVTANGFCPVKMIPFFYPSETYAKETHMVTISC